MNLSALRSLVRDYVDDVPGDMYGDPELDRALNESQRTLGAAMQKLEPAILSEHTTLVTSDTHNGISAFNAKDEYLLPKDFRKLAAFVRMSGVSGAAIGDPVAVDVVPFEAYGRYYDPTSYLLDAAYVRDYSLDEIPGETDSNHRLFELDGELATRVKDRIRRSVIGFWRWDLTHDTNGVTAPDSVQYEIHYNAIPDELVNDTDECQLPSEYHELVAVEAAHKVLSHDNSNVSSLSVLRKGLTETMAGTLVGLGGGLVEAQ